MRVLVYGGRTYDRRDFLCDVLNRQRPAPTVIISGHAGRIIKPRFGSPYLVGADRLAEAWAMDNGVSVEIHPVTDEEWATIGRKAGPLRNQRMLESGVDYAVEFPGHLGTEDMRRRLLAAGVEIRTAT